MVPILRVKLELIENEDYADDEEEDCEDDADGPSRDNDEPHLRWLQRDGELDTSNKPVTFFFNSSAYEGVSFVLGALESHVGPQCSRFSYSTLGS